MLGREFKLIAVQGHPRSSILVSVESAHATRGRPNSGYGFGFSMKCGQIDTFGGHSVLAESSRTTFGALSVSAGHSW